MLDYWIVLSKKVASRYARKHPTKAQDIYSAALEGLVVGLDELKRKDVPEDEVEYFLYSRIKFTIQDFISSDHLIPVPRRSRRRNDIPLFEVRPILCIEEENDLVKGGNATPPGFTIDDLPLEWDEIQMVDMLVDGYSKNEVAQALQITRRSVYSSLNKIRAKTKRWCNAMQISY